MKRLHRLSANVVLASACFTVYSCIGLSSILGAPPVEGDHELLDLLIDAQQTNLTLFPRGRFRAEFTKRGNIVDTVAKMFVIWDGNNSYWNYEHERRILQPENANAERQQTRGRIIETPKVFISFRKSSGPDTVVVRTEHQFGRGYVRELKVRPSEMWFTMEGKMTWRDLLDPERAKSNVTKYVVSRAGNDQVVVERHHLMNAVLRIVASLRQGGNVISYETIVSPEARANGYPFRGGTFQWERNAKGDWYLSRYEYKRSYGKDASDPAIFTSLLKISEFDSDAEIAANRFELSSLELAPGTIVTEMKGRERIRAYRLAKDREDPGEVSQEELDMLAEELKESGFGAPKRSRGRKE